MKHFCTYFAALVFVSGELPLTNTESWAKLCLFNVESAKVTHRGDQGLGDLKCFDQFLEGRFPAVAADQICCCSR